MKEELELGNVCYFENGDRGKNYPSQTAFVDKGIPFINAGNLKNNLIHKVDLNYINEERYNLLNGGKLKKNDILFCLRGSLGKFAINNEGIKGAIASSLVILRAKECLEINYLKHYLKSDRLKRLIIKSNNGSSQPNLSAANVKKFKIPLPPLAEQKKIAAILDAADSYRQKTKTLIKKYEELTQSLFLDMFGDPVMNPKGWEEILMDEACEKVTDGTHDTPIRLTEGIKFITGKHIRPYNIDYDNSDYVTKTVHDEIYRRCNPEFGDVLYTNIGVNLGTAALNKVNYEFSMKNVALFKPKHELITGRYIEYFLNSKNMKAKILWIGSIGGAQKFLSLTQLRKLKVNLPPLALQNEFAARVSAIEKQKSQAKASLLEAENLFNSLMQRAFEGGLF